MRPSAPFCLGLSVLLGLAAGCQRLDVDRTINLEPGEVRDIIIGAPRSQQNVKVDVSASGAPVDVYVVLEAERAGVEDSLTLSKRPDTAKLLASQQKVTTATLEATVPAKNDFAILLAGAAKPAEVKVKVTGR
jgi:hypothetical protein